MRSLKQWMKSCSATVAMGVAMIAATSGASADWAETKTEHFIFYGDMKISELEEQAHRLERFHGTLANFVDASSTTPVTIYIVPDIDSVQTLAGPGGRNVLGFYSATAQSAHAVTPEKVPDYFPDGMEAENVLNHEYTHHMLLANMDQFYPGWLTEGMAEFFMTAQFNKKGDVTIGAPNLARGRSMFSMNRWNAKELLASDSKKVGALEVEQKYARGWLLVHYLLLSGERKGQLTAYVNKINTGVPALTAAEEVFGDLDKLDKDLNRYSKSTGFQTIKFPVGDVDTKMPMTSRILGPGEQAIMPYRLRSAIGVDKKTAPIVAEKARPIAARFPNDPAVQRALAEMEYDAGNYDAAEAAANRALAADPKNIMAMVYLGRVAAKRALMDNPQPAMTVPGTAEGAEITVTGYRTEQWKTARSWFLKANKLDPNYALPFVLYYDSFTASGEQPSEGATLGLSRAIILAPQDDTVRVRIALDMLKNGDLKGARSIIAPAALNPHAPADNPFKQFMDKIDEGKDQAALIAFASEKKFDKMHDFADPSIFEEDKDKDGKDKPKDDKDKG